MSGMFSHSRGVPTGYCACDTADLLCGCEYCTDSHQKTKTRLETQQRQVTDTCIHICTHVHTHKRASNIGCRLLLLLLICFKVLLKIQRFSSGSLDYNECFFELLFTVMLVIGHVYKITSFSTLRERFQFWFIQWMVL